MDKPKRVGNYPMPTDAQVDEESYLYTTPPVPSSLIDTIRETQASVEAVLDMACALSLLLFGPTPDTSGAETKESMLEDVNSYARYTLQRLQLVTKTLNQTLDRTVGRR